MYELQTQKFHVLQTGSNTYTAWVYDFRLVNKMNALFGTYGDYKARDGENGIFNFSERDMVEVKKILGIKS